MNARKQGKRFKAVSMKEVEAQAAFGTLSHPPERLPLTQRTDGSRGETLQTAHAQATQINAQLSAVGATPSPRTRANQPIDYLGSIQKITQGKPNRAVHTEHELNSQVTDMENEERERDERMDTGEDGGGRGDEASQGALGTMPRMEGDRDAGQTTARQAGQRPSPVDIQAAIKQARQNEPDESNEGPTAQHSAAEEVPRALISKAKKSKKTGARNKAKKLNMLEDEMPLMSEAMQAKAGKHYKSRPTKMS